MLDHRKVLKRSLDLLHGVDAMDADLPLMNFGG